MSLNISENSLWVESDDEIDTYFRLGSELDCLSLEIATNGTEALALMNCTEHLFYVCIRGTLEVIIFQYFTIETH